MEGFWIMRVLLILSLLTISFSALTACGGGSSGTGQDSIGPTTSTSPDNVTREPDEIPSAGSDVRARWQSNMITFGKFHCDKNRIQELSTWEGSVWYYDGIRVFYQIADYTRDLSFLTCAQYVKDVYRDYVIANGGRVPGWRVFTGGLARDYLSTGDEVSRDAVVALAKNSAFADKGGDPSFEYSRETAYLILAYLDLEKTTGERSQLLTIAVDYAKSHIRQWLSSAPNVKPFMVALTAEALIEYAEHTGDSSAVADLPAIARWLRGSAWSSSAGGFVYIVCRDPRSSQECAEDIAVPAPDLNLLIAPVFSYAARLSGDQDLASFGDTVFSRGVDGAYLAGGKQFSQNYRWSFNFYKWR
jgi:hypothetical protein